MKDVFQYTTRRPLAQQDPRQYGKEMEAVAVRRYTQMCRLLDIAVDVQQTGLHVHKCYPFLAASPDGIVKDHTGEGLLEVKCPFSKQGLTAEDACSDKRFFCEIVDGEPTLKKKHSYYQIQGQLAIAEYKWCDFVVYTAHEVPGQDIHIQRIYFDEQFWCNVILPGLLYFYERAILPELLTCRVKRLGQLHTTGVGHIPFRQHQQGFFRSELQSSGLKMVIRRLT